jgi:prevent-host-death family protein
VKTVNVRDLQKNVRKCVVASQRDRVVITRHGQPAAVLVGVEGRDWEDVFYQTSASFWKMIRRRRKEKTFSIGELRRRIEKSR